MAEYAEEKDSLENSLNAANSHMNQLQSLLEEKKAQGIYFYLSPILA